MLGRVLDTTLCARLPIQFAHKLEVTIDRNVLNQLGLELPHQLNEYWHEERKIYELSLVAFSSGSEFNYFSALVRPEKECSRKIFKFQNRSIIVASSQFE